MITCWPPRVIPALTTIRRPVRQMAQLATTKMIMVIEQNDKAAQQVASQSGSHSGCARVRRLRHQLEYRHNVICVLYFFSFPGHENRVR